MHLMPQSACLRVAIFYKARRTSLFKWVPCNPGRLVASLARSCCLNAATSVFLQEWHQ
jgi:hypothetical protein